MSKIRCCKRLKYALTFDCQLSSIKLYLSHVPHMIYSANFYIIIFLLIFPLHVLELSERGVIHKLKNVRVCIRRCLSVALKTREILNLQLRHQFDYASANYPLVLHFSSSLLSTFHSCCLLSIVATSQSSQRKNSKE